MSYPTDRECCPVAPCRYEVIHVAMHHLCLCTFSPENKNLRRVLRIGTHKHTLGTEHSTQQVCRVLACKRQSYARYSTKIDDHESLLHHESARHAYSTKALSLPLVLVAGQIISFTLTVLGQDRQTLQLDVQRFTHVLLHISLLQVCALIRMLGYGRLHVVTGSLQTTGALAESVLPEPCVGQTFCGKH